MTKRNDTVIYWVSTVLIAAAMLLTAFNYFTTEEMKNEFARLGFPGYFRIQLGVAKALGAILLLLSAVPSLLKDFVYMGFTIAFISAVIAHLVNGDPASLTIKALTVLVALVVSFIYYRKKNQGSAQSNSFNTSKLSDIG